MNDIGYVITTRKICTSGGTWIPQGSFIYVKDIITADKPAKYPNLGWYANLLWEGKGYIIYFDEPIEIERWIPLKVTRLLKLVADVPICI